MKLRSLHELRAAAASGSLRKQATKILERDDDISRHTKLLALPSTHLQAVEELYGCPVAKLTGDDRDRAEKVAFLHDRNEIERFRDLISERRSLPCESTLAEFNSNLVKELATEIANLEAYLAAIPVPLEELRRRLYLAREAQDGRGGTQGVRSAFTGLL